MTSIYLTRKPNQSPLYTPLLPPQTVLIWFEIKEIDLIYLISKKCFIYILYENKGIMSLYKPRRYELHHSNWIDFYKTYVSLVGPWCRLVPMLYSSPPVSRRWYRCFLRKVPVQYDKKIKILNEKRHRVYIYFLIDDMPIGFIVITFSWLIDWLIG